MKSSAAVLITFLGIGVLILFSWFGVYAYQQRQGPALNVTQAAVVNTDSPQVSLTPVPTETPLGETPEAIILPVNPQTSVCGETTAWNVLILGSDYGAMQGVKGSDLTRMLRADFPNKKVTNYAFPRDLWVDTTGLGLTNPIINATRLGMVYYEGRIRSVQVADLDAMIDGTRATARALSKNFSLTTDHYITINLDHLPALIDAMGGLPINIPERTTDPWIGMVIEAGQQTLNGAQVSAYARAIPDSDFGRISRNKLLLEALRQKLLDPAIIVKIPDLYSKFKQVIATDLSLEQINHLACLLNEAPTNAVIQDSVRQEWTYPGPQGSLMWDRNSVINRLKELGLIP